MFTLNNPTDEDAKGLLYDERFSYIIYGFEEAPTTGTPHLQGYAELVKQTRKNTVNKWYKWWCEPRRGTQKEAIEYCKKDKKWVENGAPAAQGKRNDLDEIRKLSEEEGMRGVSRVGNAQQIRVAEKYLMYNEKCRDWKCIVMWLWGKSGVGKSKIGREWLKDMVGDDVYVKNEGSKWWDGYDGNKGILIDDYKKSWGWDWGYLLGLLDRYGFRVEFKGGSRQVLATHICVTSVHCPWDLHDDDEGELHRRVTCVTEVSG